MRPKDNLPRVLHATWGFGAPSETFIVDRLIELDRLGWQSWMAAKWLLPDPVFEFPPSDRVLVPSRGDVAVERIRRGGARDASYWLDRPIRRVRPKLVHAHFGWVAAEALAATRRHGVPLVAGFHGYDATVYPQHGFGSHDEPGERPIEPGVYRDLFRDAAAILATSRFIASVLAELGCERTVDVVPSGIRLECFPFRGPRLERDRLRLIFIGRLVPYKGLDVAIRALAALTQAPEPHLTVIGDGPERAAAESLAESLGVSSRIDFMGAQSRANVLEALEGADVLVTPSRTSRSGQAEGLGNVVKEALAVGLEVAVSDNGGLREVMPPDRHPELVPENDPGALAARIRAIDALQPHWGERARDGRSWVEETFDWRRLAPLIAATYERSLPKGGG